jgi:hypothetical protein
VPPTLLAIADEVIEWVEGASQNCREAGASPTMLFPGGIACGGTHLSGGT